MIWGLAYTLCVAVLMVRVRTPGATVPEAVRPPPDEPLWLTRVHHGLFFCLLVGAPLERLFLAGPARGRAAGALLFAGGVLLYFDLSRKPAGSARRTRLQLGCGALGCGAFAHGSF